MLYSLGSTNGAEEKPKLLSGKAMKHLLVLVEKT